MVISSRNRGILKKNRFFFNPHKSMVIFAKNRKILKKSVFFSCRNQWWFLQEIDEIRTKIKKISWGNQWGFLPETSEIWNFFVFFYLQKSIVIFARNPWNVKKNVFFVYGNQWWFLLKIDRFWEKVCFFLAEINHSKTPAHIRIADIWDICDISIYIVPLHIPVIWDVFWV